MYLSPIVRRPVPRAPIPKHPYYGITYQFIKALASAQLRDRAEKKALIEQRLLLAKKWLRYMNKMRAKKAITVNPWVVDFRKKHIGAILLLNKELAAQLRAA